MRKTVIAYIAGIVDGEAYLGIKKSTWGMRNRSDVKSPTYHERVQIRMQCGDVLKLIHKTFGGSLSLEPRVYQSVSGFKTKKPMWIYRATDKVAARLVESVKPFLIEKRVQADAILKLRKSKLSKSARLRGGPKTKRRMAPAVLARRETLYQTILAKHRS